MIHKQSILLLLTSIIAGVIIYNGCNFYNTNEKQQKNIFNNTKYKGMSRAEILATCQSCHPEQHQNEQLGPHANAYHTLLAHKEYINAAQYNMPGYTACINEVIEAGCVGCHAPQNLFEDIYAGFEFLPTAALRKMSTDTFFTDPQPRKTERFSGIDCLSCHYNGSDILASKNFKEKKENRALEGYCFPKPSSFLSTDLLCASCHHSNYNDKEDFEKIISMNCNSCHTEKTGGVSTHYTYWKNRKKEVSDSSYYENILSGLTIINDKNQIHIQLKNTQIPHAFNICRETKIIFEFRDKNNTVLTEKNIVLNRKDFHLSTIPSERFLQEAQSASELGNAFEYGAEPISFDVDKSKYKGIKAIGVTVRTKGQYWHHDSTAVETIRKVYSIN